ncbi:MAG: DUF1254 domain-containing protein [Desulfobacterales bacterium]|nr:DUF1254 domain-containing protein [Desulfobacterales bacterium]
MKKQRIKAMVFTAFIFLFMGLIPVSHADNPTPGYNNKIPVVIMTPDRVETRIGTLKFFDGMPDAATVEKIYDNLDFLRGVEVFLNFIPLTSVEGIRMGMEEVGLTRSNQCMIFDKLMDSNPLFLTGNTDTVYASVILDLKRDGATVVEIPPKCGPSTVNDAYFRFVTDMGVPGPDKGKGGKYLILPPDYKGDLNPPEGGVKATINGQEYFVSRSPSYINWLIMRGFLVDGKPDAPAKTFKEGLKVYPLSRAGSPPKMEFIRGTGKIFNTIHANTFPFYEELAHVLEREPVDFIDPELRGLAAAIGIRKGEEFKPDERMKKILIDAIAVGNATARSIWLRPRDNSAYFYKNSTWYTGFLGGDYRWLIDKGEGGRYLDARSMFFYMATVNTPAMVWKLIGKGSQYALNCTDKDGSYLDGGKNYTLNIPANVPAKDFWSVVVYDPQTRSELQTNQPYPSKNSDADTDMLVNEDGSVDFYFGPRAPEGKEKNWIQTVPGKGWFVLLRLYGPLEPWFERTWKPGEFELLK